VRLKPWAKMPTLWIQQGKLRNFNWQEDRSAGTAALMLYFTLCQFAAERPLRPFETAELEPDENIPTPPPSAPASEETAAVSTALPDNPMWKAFLDAAKPGSDTPPWGRTAGAGIVATTLKSPTPVMPNPAILQMPPAVAAQGATAERVDAVIDPQQEAPDALVARLTYDDLSALTSGLSRDRINAGLKKLFDQKMIWRVDRSSSYGLNGFGKGKRWVKLPGRALMSAGATRFAPFAHLTLRSKHELDALKLHLYYAHTRENIAGYSEVAYPTIFKKTGVQEKDIARANSLLLSCGILQRTRGLPTEDAKKHEANKYFLTGYEGFFIGKSAS
jgi:hypothetical protein